MNDILATLFLNNPYLPEQVYAFCNQLPEFRKAEQDYSTFAARLRTQLGSAEFDQFEEILNGQLAQYARAYYLFGLGLRQEILQTIGTGG